MKIRLVDYKEGVPTPVQGAYDAKKLDVEFVDLQYTKPIVLEGIVEKGLDTVSFHGYLSSELEHTCGRCLHKVKAGINEPFEMFYESKGLEFIETLDDLREVLILVHPIAFVCREDCRGLCPYCGVNRNETACQCEENASTRSLAALKDVWKKKKQE